MRADADGAAVSGVSHGVVQQDHQNLFDPVGIGDHVGQLLVHIELQMDTLLLGVLPVALVHVVDELADVEGGFLHIFRAGLEPGQLEHVGDEPGEPLHLVEHDAVIPHLHGVVLDHPVGKGLKKPPNGGQRCAQLVGDIGDVVPPHLLQVLDLRHVLEEAHHAGAGVVLPHDRHDGDPQILFPGQRIPQGVGFTGFQHPPECLPNLCIGDKIVGRFHVHGPEHLHESRVIVGQVPGVVQRRHAVGEAGKNVPQLPLFAVQLIDGLGDGVAHAVHGPGKDANLPVDVLVCPHAVVPVGELNGYLGHVADGLVDLSDAGQGDDEQHRHDGDAQDPQGRVQLAEGGVDVLYLAHEDKAALDLAVAPV